MNDFLFTTEEQTGRPWNRYYDWMRPDMFHLVTSLDQLKDLIEKAKQSQKVSIDIETQGLNTRTYKGKPLQEIVGIGFCFERDIGYYVPIFHEIKSTVFDDEKEEKYEKREFSSANLPKEEVYALFSELINTTKTIWHNWKFDSEFFYIHGVDCPTMLGDIPAFEDTMVKAKLYDPNKKQAGLKGLSKEYLGREMISIKQIASNAKNDVDFGGLDPTEDACIVYACSDVINTYALCDRLDEMIKEDYPFTQEFLKKQTPYEESLFYRNFNLIYRMELKTIRPVRNIERTLVEIDVPFLQKKLDELTTEKIAIEKKLYELAGREFKIAGDDLSKILVAHGVPLKYKGKDGKLSTSEAILGNLSKDYPICADILKWRKSEKVIGTYINNLLDNHDEDGCIKIGLNQQGTESGRFSSRGGKGIKVDGGCKVNIQNIPPVIRQAFKARKGYRLTCIDFAGQELRIMANCSGETRWIEEYLGKPDPDIHGNTTTIVFGLTPEHENFQKIRKVKSKAINFAVLYGGNEYTIAQKTGDSVEKGKEFLDAYLKGLPYIQNFIKETRDATYRYGDVYTTFGRRRVFRRLPEIREALKDRNLPKEERREYERLRDHYLNAAQNHKIQGAAADILKLGLIKLNDLIEEKGWHDKVHVLFTVHDEVDLEIKEEYFDEVICEIVDALTLKNILQDRVGWKIPLMVDCEYGPNWDVTNDYFKENIHRILDLEVAQVDTEQIRTIRKLVAESNSDGDLEIAPEDNAPSQEAQIVEAKEEVQLSGGIQYNSQELVDEYLACPMAYKDFVYKLRTPLSERSVNHLNFLLDYCKPGSNNLTIVSPSNDILLEEKVDALSFTILARYHNY